MRVSRTGGGERGEKYVCKRGREKERGRKRRNPEVHGAERKKRDGMFERERYRDNVLLRTHARVLERYI